MKSYCSVYPPSRFQFCSINQTYLKKLDWWFRVCLPPFSKVFRSCLRNHDDIGLSALVRESNIFLTEFSDTEHSTSRIEEMSIPSSVDSASFAWFVIFKESSSNFFLNSSASNVPVTFRISLIFIPLFVVRHSSWPPLIWIISSLKRT